MVETNYGKIGRAGSPSALAGAAHLHLIELDAWLAERGLGGAITDGRAGPFLMRLRQELTLYPFVAMMPGGVTWWTRLRAALGVLLGRRPIVEGFIVRPDQVGAKLGRRA
jgi:hypothetical protein